jgi:hypothetical protein
MRSKRVLLLLTAITGALMILAWSQTWFDALLDDGRTVVIPGSSGGAGVLATGLAALAIAAALTIAPRAVRYALGALGLVVGAIATAVAVAAVADPLGASIATLTAETGVAGRESIGTIVTGVATLPWPWVAAAAGLLTLLAGAGVLATAGRWPAAGARYERTPTAPDDWDVLTEGDDPTR